MKHRKGSVARAIQDYFLSGAYEEMIENPDCWCWFKIPQNIDFCVALEWQDGYEGDESDKEIYGPFMDGEWVINVSIKDTDEFALNGSYALYAETYYATDEELESGLQGGTSLCQSDIDDDFYAVSKALADEFLQYYRKPRLR